MPRRMIVIPKGTKAVACKKAPDCPTMIYWVPPLIEGGKRHPVSCAPAGCIEPTAEKDGLGVSHFSDCAFAHEFRKAKPDQPAS